MIWNTVKFIALGDIVGWIAFIAVALVLGPFAVRAEGATAQVILWVVGIGLYFWAYQFLQRRWRARRTATHNK